MNASEETWTQNGGEHSAPHMYGGKEMGTEVKGKPKKKAWMIANWSKQFSIVYNWQTALSRASIPSAKIQLRSHSAAGNFSCVSKILYSEPLLSIFDFE